MKVELVSKSDLYYALEVLGPHRGGEINDPLLKQTVRLLGGWGRLCEMTYHEIDNAYKALGENVNEKRFVCILLSK